MLKRALVIALLVPTLVLCVQQNRLVHGIAMTPQEVAALDSLDSVDSVDSNDTPDITNAEKSKKEGNGFVRALKAPFKAFGRLFGGKKNDSKNLGRITDKDLRKFETLPAQSINDAKSGEKTASDAKQAAPVPASNTAFSEYLAKGKQFLNAGDFDGAVGALSRAASIDAKSAEVKNLLGIAYEGKGMRERALESFKAAIQADKNNAEYLNNYGFLLYKNNDDDDATKYLKRAAKLSPNDARIWNNLGLVQARRRKFDDAFESFVRAGGEFNGHVNLANQLYATGYAKDAIAHLEKAQALQPNSAEVLAKLVSLYELTGRISDAQAARRSIVALRTFAEANK